MPRRCPNVLGYRTEGILIKATESTMAMLNSKTAFELGGPIAVRNSRVVGADVGLHNSKDAVTFAAGKAGLATCMTFEILEFGVGGTLSCEGVHLIFTPPSGLFVLARLADWPEFTGQVTVKSANGTA
jgi:hypothetical protein